MATSGAIKLLALPVDGIPDFHRCAALVAENVSFHRTSRWHWDQLSVGRIGSGERKLPPGEPVALGSVVGALHGSGERKLTGELVALGNGN
jgi:hypothetical protein